MSNFNYRIAGTGSAEGLIRAAREANAPPETPADRSVVHTAEKLVSIACEKREATVDLTVMILREGRGNTSPRAKGASTKKGNS